MARWYVGERVDAATHARTGERVELDPADLTTHGVIVGMTGSGKTGLGLVLIEEALRSGVPVLMIDPKGDLGNLALTFPGLRAEDFRPWIDQRAAAKEGIAPDELAARQAARWAEGLEGWGLGGADIEALRAAAPVTIYTPGSTAGTPLNIVGSLRAPARSEPTAHDPETVRDEVDGYVSGLLGLVGIESDPLASREHILLANLIETAWASGRDLDLATLVAQVATPPLRKLGVFELDAFFPPDARMALAMRLNGLLASPAFAAWAQGRPLDIADLLLPGGRPAGAIVSTAHLSDAERLFVTALVLGKVVTWMRAQSGTTDLRALVYIDEVAGYLPPTAVPPTKAPILTLMKQARAYGVGVVLATQNPVDVDYKALSNAGTWMVGRLQTERDRARLLDGMRAAAGGVDVGAVGDTISGLAKREFVLRRAGHDAPEVITTRWAMSYLRGPLTKDQIALLTADAPAGALPPPVAADAVPLPPPPSGAPPPPEVAPEVAAGVPVWYLDPAAPWARELGVMAGGPLQAAAVARIRLLYDDTAADVRHTEEWEAVLCPLTTAPDVTAAIAVDYDDRDLRTEVPAGATYVPPDAPIDTKAWWAGLKRAHVDHLVATRSVEVFRNTPLKLWSRVGETEESFAVRCRGAADAGADDVAAALRDKYETRLRRAGDALAKAEDRAEVAATEAEGRRTEELLGTAGGLLGAFLGGRRGSTTRGMAGAVLGRLGGGAGRRTRTSASRQRADSARNRVDEAAATIDDLEAELAEDLAEIGDTWQAKADAVEPVAIALERSDVHVVSLGLVWVPAEGLEPSLSAS